MPNEKKNHLLTPQERAVCAQIALGKVPHSQRAAALLALDEGATQIKAAEHAGLTKGQLKYWLTKFRQQRLDIFPDDLLAEIQAQTSARPPSETEVAEELPGKTDQPHPQAVVVKASKVKGGKKAAAKKGKKKPQKGKGKKKPEKAKGKAKPVKAKKAKADKEAAVKALKKKTEKAKKKALADQDDAKAKKAKRDKKRSAKKKSKK